MTFKPSQNPRPSSVTLRVSAKERKALNKQRGKQSVSEYLRTLIFGDPEGMI